MSAVVAASASPTLARQFTVIANVTVVIIMYVYVASCIALFRMTASAPAAMKLPARVIAIAALLFCLALIASSEPDLLIWSGSTVVIAGLAYVPIRLRRLRTLTVGA